MGSVVSKVTDAVGLTDNAGAEDARAQSAQSAAFSQAMTKEQLEFQKEQYEDWKDIYGDLQENLGEYYNNLDPEDYEARGLQAVQKDFQMAKDRAETSLAQRGLSSSGIQAATDVAMESQAAMGRANVRMNAPDQVANMKQGFLGLGLGQGTQMLGIQAGVANTGAQTGASMASNFGSQGTQLSMANMDVMGSLAGMGAKAAFPTIF